MKNFLKSGGLVIAGSLAGVTVANAAVSTAVLTSLTDATTDVGTVGAAVLVIIVAAATFKYIRKAL